jgi:ABC-2 type transport system ATP-binding protein
LRSLLSDLAGERIVILSTHIVSDAEAAATRIAVINRGRLLTSAPPEVLLQSVAGKVWQWVVPSAHLNAVRQHHLVSSTARRPDGVHVRVVSDSAPGPAAIGASPVLEEAYLYLLANANGTTGGDAP